MTRAALRRAHHVLSKRAIEAYSDSLRRELGFLGIPVIKIQPGSYRTAINRRGVAGLSTACWPGKPATARLLRA